jgi:hypothetical protein
VVPPPLTKPELPDGVVPRKGVAVRDVLPPWTWWAIPAAIVLGLALGAIGDLLVSIVGAASGASTSHPPPAVNIVSDIVFDVGFVAAAIYVASVLGPLRPSEFGYRRAPLVRVLGMLPLAAAVYFIATAAYASLLGLHGNEQLPTGLGSTSDTAAMIGVGLFVTVIAPIAEEFFFRGFIFGLLRSWLAGRAWGPWVAAIITGLMFGAAHAGSAAVKYLLPLAFLGFLLCLLRWKTGSLYPGIDELHWNAAKMAVLALLALGAIAAITGRLGWREPAVEVDGLDERGGPAAVASAVGSVGPPGA